MEDKKLIEMFIKNHRHCSHCEMPYLMIKGRDSIFCSDKCRETWEGAIKAMPVMDINKHTADLGKEE